MLDLLGIMFSTVMILIVIVRAAQRDSREPWFEVRPDPNAASPAPAKARAWAAIRAPAVRKPTT